MCVLVYNSVFAVIVWSVDRQKKLDCFGERRRSAGDSGEFHIRASKRALPALAAGGTESRNQDRGAQAD